VGCPLSPRYQSLSLWHETADDDWAPRPALPGDREADVAIVGAGFTGLWTALYLARADPSLRIAVVEAETAGFGASGRNGGFAVASLTHGIGNGLARFEAEMPVLERLALENFDGIRADLEREGEVEGFAFDAFERMSMEAAADDALAQAHVEGFWRMHVPLLLSVCGSYQHFALVLAGERRGAVVYGCEPEFEETETVAESLPAFLQRLVDVLDGGDDVAPFSFALPTPGP